MKRTRTILLTYSTSYPDKFVESCKKYGWDYYLILDKRWISFRYKFEQVIKLLDYLRKYYDYAISLDSFDCLVVRFYDEFVPSDNKLVLAAETNCWPDQSLRNNYPGVDSPFRFVNSLFCIDLNQPFIPGFKEITDLDDQLHLSKFYLDHKNEVKLDTKCEIFQTLYGFGKENFDSNLINKLTKTKPFFMHGNGKVDMSWIGI